MLSSDPEYLLASSVRYNIARIVRLPSGRFALFSPWAASGSIDLIAIGTLEEIARLIPTPDQCIPTPRAKPAQLSLSTLLGF